MKYFAYGSNSNPRVMKRKQVAHTSAEKATLAGYRLLFNKRALREALPEGIGFANINLDPTGTVEGILYDVVDADADRLDESERYPDHYTRVDVTVETDAGPVAAVAYQAQPDKIADGLRPSRNYLNHILAARDFLSWQYFDALDKSLTFAAPCACCTNTAEVNFIRESDRLHMLCQPCREARLLWGDTLGRPLSIPEAAAIMTQLVQPGPGHDSIHALVMQAVEAKIIEP